MSNRGSGASAARMGRLQSTERQLEMMGNLVNLLVRDLTAMGTHVNFLGQMLQATINVLGQGPVQEEFDRLERLKKSMNGPPPPPPPGIAELAVAEEQALAIKSAAQELAKPEDYVDGPAPVPEAEVVTRDELGRGDADSTQS